MTTILIIYAAIVTIVAIAYALAYARVKAEYIEYRIASAMLAKEMQDYVLVNPTPCSAQPEEVRHEMP